MKKPAVILLSIALSAGLLTSCGGGTKEEVPATSEEGVLKVAIVNGNDRFARDISGAPEGIEADIAKLVADAGGYAVRLTVAESADAMISGVQNGDYDLGFGRIADTDERISGMAVSACYGKGGLFLATPKYNYMDCLTLMQTGTLGVSKSAEPLMDQVEGAADIAKENYNSVSELASSIANGTVLAGLVSEREAASMINENVQVQELINSPREQYVAVMPAGSPLAGTVNSVIGQYKVDNASKSGE